MINTFVFDHVTLSLNSITRSLIYEKLPTWDVFSHGLGGKIFHCEVFEKAL